jgi:hypothetical protein
MTIGKRISVGFIVVVLITVALGVFIYSTLHSIAVSSTSVTTDSLPGIEYVLTLSGLQRQNVVNLLFHLQSTDPAETSQIETAMSTIAGIIPGR